MLNHLYVNVCFKKKNIANSWQKKFIKKIDLILFCIRFCVFVFKKKMKQSA